LLSAFCYRLPTASSNASKSAPLNSTFGEQSSAGKDRYPLLWLSIATGFALAGILGSPLMATMLLLGS
jgi:hypothetical protein